MNLRHHDTLIIGAGLSGLSVAHYLLKSRPDADLQILEKTDRTGGAIQTLRESGYLAEWGPHGFLDNVEESRQLVEELDFGEDLQKASLRQFLRYICLGGELKPIPQSPPKIIGSDLLPWSAKLRMMADIWKKPRSEEQSVADWVAYRFGPSVLPFADVAMTGTFAGDIETLSIDAALPGLRRLELEHGSIFRGAMRLQKDRKRKTMPAMVSFRRGMEQLVERLAEDKPIHFRQGVDSISRDENGWRVKTGDSLYMARQLVIACPINPALTLLDPLSPAPRKRVRESIIYNVVLGFGGEAEIPFGFGYLAPKQENRFALGALFPTHMFPGRAPQGMQTLEVLVGGLRNPDRLNLDEDTLTESVLKDVKELIRLPQRPLFSRLLRTDAGIPQLEMGHQALQSYRERMEIEQPGLFICGFGWEGIGTNEMIKMARRTAGQMLNERRDRRKAAIKGVYF